MKQLFGLRDNLEWVVHLVGAVSSRSVTRFTILLGEARDEGAQFHMRRQPPSARSRLGFGNKIVNKARELL
jgi:hypothetical protein